MQVAHLLDRFSTNVSGAMLSPSLIQVTESISGSVVPLAMFIIFEFTIRQFIEKTNPLNELLYNLLMIFKLLNKLWANFSC